MSIIRRRGWVAGFLLGLGPTATTSLAQQLPPVFPPSDEPPVPAASRPIPAMVEAPPVVRPAPPVIVVPPEGVGPSWMNTPPDPIALQRKQPSHVEKKARSWHWRRLQGKFWGYPEEYEPRPLGAALYDHGRIMTANATMARLVLYRYDFIEGTSELSPRGLDQLARFTPQLAASPFPLIIERTPDDPTLAESRRYMVLARMARGPFPVPSERVLVGVPAPSGMSGSDAQIIAGNSLGRTQQYGPPIPLLSNGVNSPSGVTSNATSPGGAVTVP